MGIGRNNHQVRSKKSERKFQVAGKGGFPRLFHLLIITAVFLFLGFCVQADVTSFPGVSGGGSVTVGGRGGVVIEVTNLNDAGPGSLREACEASGARTVVFRVGGIITLTKAIVVENSYITIAGQTAPGGGITIRSSEGVTQTPLLFKNSHDIIVRYIRVRPGPYANDQAGDCIGTYIHAHNIVIDHCSLSWAKDENTEIFSNSDPAHNVTWSWNIIAEAIGSHSCGMLLGSGVNSNGMHDFSVHHNLFAHNHHRNPLLKVKTVEFINNIIYGWQKYSTQVGGGTTIDIIGNKYVKHPGLSDNRREVIWKPHDPANANPAATGPTGNPSIYFVGNIGHNNSDPNADGWDTMMEMADLKSWGYFENQRTSVPIAYRRTTRRATPTPVNVDNVVNIDDVLLPAIGACRRLDEKGNFVENRDAVDTRVINEYQTLTGSIPATVTNADYPTIASGTPYADNDHDGMADVWETANGLNPNDASDRNGTNLSSEGFTNLEMFLSGTAGTTHLEQLLLDASSGANPNVTYIVSGPSTRDNAFNEMISYYTEQFAKINVPIVDNAVSGMSATEWVNNSRSSGIANAVAASEGDGENTILEFSFGGNSYGEPDIKGILRDAINLYRAEKPKATVILVSPLARNPKDFQAELLTMYQELSVELGLKMVDGTYCTESVHGDSRYYEDGTHPNKWGSRRVVNYICDQILPSELYSVMTLEEAPQQTGWMSIDDINAGLNIRLEKATPSPNSKIGISTVFTTTTTNSNARACGPYTVPENCTIESLSVYHEGDNDTGATLEMAVYADNSGVPGNRLKITSNVQVNNAAGWQTISLPTDITANEGQAIWLAWKFSVNPGMRYANIAGNPVRYDEQNNSLESTFVTGSSTSANYSLFATYTPSTAPNTYTLNVSSGSGDGNYAAGTSVSISANSAPAGQHFTNWTTANGGSFANANSASTTFTMPANNVTITANYADGTTSHSADTDNDWSISQSEVNAFIADYANNNNSVNGDSGSFDDANRITMREVVRVIYLHNGGNAYKGATGTVDGYNIDGSQGDPSSAPLSKPVENNTHTLVCANSADSGAGSFRNAIANSEHGDTITFDESLDKIILASEILIDKSITIDGNGVTIISGDATTRIFRVYNENEDIFVTILNIGIVDASNSGDEFGGAIYNNGENLTLENCLLNGNANIAENGKGGAVYTSGSVTATNCVFTDNSAEEENDIYTTNDAVNND